MSLIDRAYRSVNPLRLFTGGYGPSGLIRQLMEVQERLTRRTYHPDDKLDIVRCGKEGNNTKTIRFRSPARSLLDLPSFLHGGHFQLVRANGNGEAFCIILATTGDHGFTIRRRMIAEPLANKFGVTCAILENPFYGSRKPADQLGSALRHVSDLFLMGLVLIIECETMFRWALRHDLVSSDKPLIICGSSLGGFMGSLVSASHANDLPDLIGVLSLCGSNASPVFTHGLVSNSVHWDRLAAQADQFLQAFPRFEPVDGDGDAQRTRRLTFNVLDHFTNLKRWPVPNRPELISLIEARNDSYIPREVGQTALSCLWPGSRIVDSIQHGHVVGTLLSHKTLLVKHVGNALENYWGRTCVNKDVLT